MDTTLLKSLVMDKESKAKFDYAKDGSLYYVVGREKKYRFPVDMRSEAGKADVGTTTFNAVERAVTMMRYIRKAMDKNALTEMVDDITDIHITDKETVKFSHAIAGALYYETDDKYMFSVEMEDGETFGAEETREDMRENIETAERKGNMVRVS